MAIETGARAAFAFSTKDRVELSRRSIASLKGSSAQGRSFDLIWLDGSSTPEGRALPHELTPPAGRLVEVHHDVVGGADAAIRFGLRRLLDLGYDYCGLIENDIRFEPGWFDKLMEAFEKSLREGLPAGAATARTLASRVLAYRRDYALLFNLGAGMALFKRDAAEIILESYHLTHARTLRRYFLSTFQVDIGRNWEVFMEGLNPLRPCDSTYAMDLCREGRLSLGLVPTMASNMDADLEKLLRTAYVRARVVPTAEDERVVAAARALALASEKHRRLRGAVRRLSALLRLPLLSARLKWRISGKKKLKRALAGNVLGRRLLNAYEGLAAIRGRLRRACEANPAGRAVFRAYAGYKASATGYKGGSGRG